jgi:pimeloyl-ACP methyl ester carboxylesterase
MKLTYSIIILIMSTATNFANAQQPTGQYANVNGVKMYYEIHGEGFPLVLIHGGGSTIGTTFGRILPSLAKHHKVIAVEMQAHGHTADIDRPLSFTQDADDVAELLRQLNVNKADIFGFSNGASTTLQIAIRYPQLVNKIVVASTMYKRSGAPSWFWDMMANASFDGMPQIYKDEFLKINPDKNALMRMYERDVVRMQSFKDVKDEEIAGIAAPALIVAADKDVVTPEHLVEMYRRMQNAKLMILPGGHGDYIGEIATLRPGQTEFPALTIIEDFLK